MQEDLAFEPRPPPYEPVGTIHSDWSIGAAAVAACHWYATTLAGSTPNSPGRPRDRMRRRWGSERLGADQLVAVAPDHGDDCPEGPHRSGSLRQHWDRPAASLLGSGSGSALVSAVARIDVAVVDIHATLEGGTRQVAGTGMITTSSGEALANIHVNKPTASITAQVDGTGPVYSATVVGDDPTADVALTQIHWHTVGCCR